LLLGFAPARESLDDDHAAAAAGTWTRQYALLIICCGLCRLGLIRAKRHGQQLARSRKVGGTVAFGKQSIMANAMETLGAAFSRRL
jgi:hypothetical protein